MPTYANRHRQRPQETDRCCFWQCFLASLLSVGISCSLGISGGCLGGVCEVSGGIWVVFMEIEGTWMCFGGVWVLIACSMEQYSAYRAWLKFVKGSWRSLWLRPLPCWEAETRTSKHVRISFVTETSNACCSQGTSKLLGSLPYKGNADDHHPHHNPMDAHKVEFGKKYWLIFEKYFQPWVWLHSEEHHKPWLFHLRLLLCE